jgi:hypothetical protein
MQDGGGSGGGPGCPFWIVAWGGRSIKHAQPGSKWAKWLMALPENTLVVILYCHLGPDWLQVTVWVETYLN